MNLAAYNMAANVVADAKSYIASAESQAEVSMEDDDGYPDVEAIVVLTLVSNGFSIDEAVEAYLLAIHSGGKS